MAQRSTPPYMRPPKAPAHWDQRFLVLASHIAGWSRDPSTKVGAVAVRQKRILGTGYNGLPTNVFDSDARLNDRDTRLAMTVHAEANLVAYAARNGVSLVGSTVYVFPLMTCGNCAGLLIQADVSRIVVPDFVEPQRWQQSFDAAREMLNEAGVIVERLPMHDRHVSTPQTPDDDPSAPFPVMLAAESPQQ